MGWTICRIDGSTSPLDRREEMNRFQTGGDDPDAPRLFLLSTRAGGLGINLVAADTVIFYDQDWVNLNFLIICTVVNNSHRLFLESSNGCSSTRQSASYWPDSACAYFQACQCTHSRNQDHAACDGEAQVGGSCYCQR